MTRTFTVKLGKSPDDMTFDECMAHIKRILFWDYVDGEWCDVEILNDIRWEELAGYIRGAHEREFDALKAKNAKLCELIRAAWRCIHTGATCSDCRLIAGGCILKTAMRELGIEVDG